MGMIAIRHPAERTMVVPAKHPQAAKIQMCLTQTMENRVLAERNNQRVASMGMVVVADMPVVVVDCLAMAEQEDLEILIMDRAAKVSTMAGLEEPL